MHGTHLSAGPPRIEMDVVVFSKFSLEFAAEGQDPFQDEKRFSPGHASAEGIHRARDR